MSSAKLDALLQLHLHPLRPLMHTQGMLRSYEIVFLVSLIASRGVLRA